MRTGINYAKCAVTAALFAIFGVITWNSTLSIMKREQNANHIILFDPIVFCGLTTRLWSLESASKCDRRALWRQPLDCPTRQHLDYPTRHPLEYSTQQHLDYPTRQHLDYPTQQPLDYPARQPLDYPTRQPLNYPRRQALSHPTRQHLDYPTQ